jgi:cytochrome c-type biogenesis protein CcsB
MFEGRSETMVLFALSLIGYFVAALANHLGMVTKKKPIASLGLGLTILAAVLHVGIVVQRWVVSGQPPMVQLYELILVYSWLIVVVAVVVSVRFSVVWLRSVAAAIGALSLASTSFPGIDDAVKPLVPALQSNWLTVHVATSFISYAGFTVAFILGVAFLAKQARKSAPNSSGELADQYESLVYKCIMFSFPLLTVAIVTGAVWAKTAWARYWSWDPKEVWSLVTWLIYAIYLHLRVRPGWRGKRAIFLNMAGFAAMLFTWFGVNYLLAGLHSYK